MRVPLVDLRAQYAGLREEMHDAVEEILSTASLIGGQPVADFEAAFAAFCGAAHAVGTSSGTDALVVALLALGISPGDEVVMPAHTFVATSEAVRLIGAVPVFADIDAASFNISPESAAARITPRTRAIVPVHLYGKPADMAAIGKLAEARGLDVLCDAAQAHGAVHAGRPVAHWGRASTFSFYPGKNLGAYGDAGAIVTDDADLAARARMIANHGRTSKYLHETAGLNARLDALQAAFLSIKLKRLAEWCAARRAHAADYDRRLAPLDRVITPDLGDNDTHAMHLYVIRVPAADRDALLDHLHERGIGAGIHYPVALHLQPCNADLGGRAGDLPVTETVAAEIVSLPMYPELTEAQIDFVVDGVASYFDGR